MNFNQSDMMSPKLLMNAIHWFALINVLYIYLKMNTSNISEGPENTSFHLLKMGFSNLRDSGSVPWTILNFGGKSPAYYLLSKTNNK